MGYYRDPYAAAYVSQLIRDKLQKSKISIADFALCLGLKSVAQVESILTGRRHFPAELVKPTARVLDIDEGQLGYFTLLIYFPVEAMTVNFEAIGAYRCSLENTKKDEAIVTAKKKKNKKSRNRS